MARKLPGVSVIDGRQLQTKLKGFGYDPGAVDGIVGPKTYAALFDYSAGRRCGEVSAKLGAAASVQFLRYDLSTGLRVAHFMAQIANETGGFQLFEENLKYSVKAIRACWPNRFPTDASAQPYAWNPKDADREDMALAARVYGQRMGNLPAALDNDDKEDGWQYRGRGLLQLTGRANYEWAGQAIGVDLLAHPELVAADLSVGLEVSLAFWKKAKVNAAADCDDVRRARQLTNGGSIGLDHVTELLTRIKKVLV